jgi:glycosyltransferase domain-containing protein
MLQRTNGSQLTIVLTLKGRHLHTLRWLWHADRVRLPFHVVVADGAVHPSISRIMKNTKSFPNLSFEYHEYDDASLSDFYRKCANAVGKVKTPYVRFADNDDFLFVSGSRRNVEFLDNNRDYVCAQGGVAGFSLQERRDDLPNVTGVLSELNYRYANTYVSRDIAEPSALERVLGEARHYHSIYYGTYRTTTLKTIVDEVVLHDFSSTQIHERFSALRAVAIGKVRSDPSCLSYLRQKGVSLRLTSSRDWVYHLVRERYTQDIQSMVSGLAETLADANGKDREVIEEQLREAYGEHLREWLSNRYGIPKKRLRSYFSFAKKGLRFVPKRKFVRESFFRRLSADGAPWEVVDLHRKELVEIETTLDGEGFRNFVERWAPDLLLRGSARSSATMAYADTNSA